ncbi:hypothetical protein [Dehalogenimonas alkenigignens]|nr:hypothetical protein [Dehalogenimonas alkenigignens]
MAEIKKQRMSQGATSTIDRRAEIVLKAYMGDKAEIQELDTIIRSVFPIDFDCYYAAAKSELIRLITNSGKQQSIGKSEIEPRVPTNNKVCVFCSRKLKPEDIFCIYCGKKVG